MKRMKVKKKPIIVEAIEITEDFIRKLSITINNTKIIKYNNGVLIKTLEDNMKGNIGDFIIIGVNNECYPIKRDIFFNTYEIIK